jgi:uncharacterized membrane protein YgcG
MQKRQIFFTDIIIEVAIPLLIIGLIWSTVVFAITVNNVAYPGDSGILKLVFFCYVMGTVMINRIAGYYHESGKAAAYSIVLVGLMAIFALQFSGGQGMFFGGRSGGAASLPLNLAIVVIVGIVSYKIARESCLDLKDTVKEKTALQLKSELMARRDWYRRAELEEEQELEQLEEEKKEAEEKPDPEKERVPKTHPGIWIIYFSLFSMIVFAVGQRLLPKDDGELYRYTFTCLAANLMCALALLSLITLSSVRQRSWQKRALVRPGVGWFWIMAGMAIIVVVVSLATLPPRPVPSYRGRRIAKDEFSGSSTQEQPEEVARSSKTWAGQTKQIEAQLEKEERDKARFIEEQRKKQEGEEGEKGQKASGEDRKDGEESGDSSSSSGGASGSGKGKGQPEKQGSSESQAQKGNQSSSGRRASAPRLPPAPTPALAGLQTLGKYIVIIICVIAGIWALIMVLKALGRSNPLQKLSGALKRFRENLKKMVAVAKMLRLSGRKLRTALEEQDLYMENPFRNKTLLNRMSREELVSYTYKAFENFSHVHGYTPSQSQTAVEFVESLPEEFRETEFSVLVKLFMIAEYSDRPISDKNIKYLKQTWNKIET